MTIFLFRDETEITYYNSRISRQDQDFRKLFLVVEQEQMKLTLVENSLDREFLLNSVVGLRQLSRGEDNCSKSRYQNGLAEHTFCHFLHRVTLVETGVKELVDERPLHSLMVIMLLSRSPTWSDAKLGLPPLLISQAPLAQLVIRDPPNDCSILILKPTVTHLFLLIATPPPVLGSFYSHSSHLCLSVDITCGAKNRRRGKKDHCSYCPRELAK